MLLSGVSFDGQFLFIDGTAKGDRVVLSTDRGELSLRITFNGHTTLLPTQSVASILVSMGGGDDEILTDADFPLELSVESGTGDDIVRGGRQGDTIDGGAGDDVLSGNRGRDVLRAGAGRDTLIGGPGGDVLLGQAGRDSFKLDLDDTFDRLDDRRDRDRLDEARKRRRERFDIFRGDDDFFFISFNSGLTGGGLGWSGFFSF